MLNQIVNVLCNNANWKTPYFHSEKKCSFFLEKNLELFLFAPNNEQIIFYIPLIKLPSHDYYSFTKIIAQKATGMYKKRTSMISVTENTLMLHKIVSTKELEQNIIIHTAKELLNDAELWKNIISTIK